MSFFARVLNHLINEVLVQGLANKCVNVVNTAAIIPYRVDMFRVLIAFCSLLALVTWTFFSVHSTGISCRGALYARSRSDPFVCPQPDVPAVCSALQCLGD